MGDTLVRAGWGLVGVAIVVPGRFRPHFDAVEPFGRGAWGGAIAAASAIGNATLQPSPHLLLVGPIFIAEAALEIGFFPPDDEAVDQGCRYQGQEDGTEALAEDRDA